MVLSEGIAPVVVDIVFVHGLRGGNVKTWMKDNVLWPRDLLAQDIPNARIMTVRTMFDLLWNRSSSLATLCEDGHASITLIRGLTRIPVGATMQMS